MKLEFAKSESYTLGVEIELQIVDRETLELTPKAPQLLSRWGDSPKVQPEIFQSMIELSTGIWRSRASTACATSRPARIRPRATRSGSSFPPTDTTA